MALLPQIPTVAIKYRPTTKVRKLHWENVAPVAFESSIWSKLVKEHSAVEESLHSAGLLQEIDDAFELKETKSLKTISKSTSSTTSSLITVISEKRAQNVMIFLGTIKSLGVEGLMFAIRTFDDGQVSENILKQCQNSLPTLEEEKLLSGIDREAVGLRGAEQFMLAMCGMYRYRQRLDTLLFKLRFPDDFQQLKLQLFSYRSAFSSISKSNQFQKLLQILLIIGNYMNASGASKSIAGFKVSFLEKVSIVVS
jgi:hypothetical protein